MIDGVSVESHEDEAYALSYPVYWQWKDDDRAPAVANTLLDQIIVNNQHATIRHEQR